MSRHLLLLLALAGCGRFGFGSQTGGTDSASGGDAPLGTFGSFGTPRIATELNAPQDDNSPTLSGDGLDIVFASLRTGGGVFHTWSATRASTDVPFSNLTQLVIAGVDHASEAAFSRDGLTLYFRRDSTALASVTRPDRGTGWSTSTAIAELAGFDGADFGAADLHLVLFKAGAPDALYESTRPALQAAWPPPQQIAELASASKRSYPTLRSDGLEMLFENDELGPRQIFRAARTSLDTPFALPTHVAFGPPFDGAIVGDPELSDDGATMWFASNATGNFQLYEVTRARE